MTYEGQVAGVPDDVPSQRAKSLVVRRLKSLSLSQLEVRRREIADALRDVAELEFWNAGGSGSVEATAPTRSSPRSPPAPACWCPTLFDHYQSLRAAPGGVLRPPRRTRPVRRLATVHGGGLVASGPAGADRLPTPWAPAGPAPDRARGRRRGADPAHRAGRRAAADRRPGLVPARQVRRAVRARRPRAPAAGRRSSSTTCRPTAATASPSDVRAGTGRRPALARPPTLGAGRLVCVDGPAGLRQDHARRRGAPRLDRRVRWSTWTTCTTGLGRARRASATQLDALAAPPGRRAQPGSYRRYDWHRERSRRPSTVAAPVRPAGPRGRRLRLARLDADRARCWCGSRRRRPADAPRASSATARPAPHWRRWVADEAAALRGTRHPGAGRPACVDGDRVPVSAGQLGRTQRPQLGAPRPLRPRPVGALDAHRRAGGAVGEVERHPRGARAEVHRDDLRPTRTRGGGSR